VEGCFIRTVKGIKFPHPEGGEVIVNYPFLLVPPS
jgi:hypothetical protein